VAFSGMGGVTERACAQLPMPLPLTFSEDVADERQQQNRSANVVVLPCTFCTGQVSTNERHAIMVIDTEKPQNWVVP
jgi:hypothetical protein